MEAKDDKHTATKPLSSWTAAIAQLPGYPPEQKPVIAPAPTAPVRDVSLGDEEEDRAT